MKAIISYVPQCECGRTAVIDYVHNTVYCCNKECSLFDIKYRIPTVSLDMEKLDDLK